MKNSYFFLLLFLLLVAGCTKQQDQKPATASDNNSGIPGESGSGSGGSGSGGGSGGGTMTGPLRTVLTGTASRLKATSTDSILVTFTQPAPSAGWTLSLTSSNPSAAQVPSTFFVPPGTTGIYFRVTGGNITNGTTVTITVRLNGQSKTASIKVFPLTAVFPPPQLQSPGDGANFKSREIVTFTSNTNNNAYFYHIQIAQNTTFDAPITNLLLNDPLWRESAFRGAGTYFWRMRFVAAAGGGGPWSEVRRFVQRQEQ